MKLEREVFLICVSLIKPERFAIFFAERGAKIPAALKPHIKRLTMWPLLVAAPWARLLLMLF